MNARLNSPPENSPPRTRRRREEYDSISSSGSSDDEDASSADDAVVAIDDTDVPANIERQAINAEVLVSSEPDVSPTKSEAEESNGKESHPKEPARKRESNGDNNYKRVTQVATQIDFSVPNFTWSNLIEKALLIMGGQR